MLSVGLAIPAAAVAQTNTTKATNLEEIVVTAQKREERLQDIPLAVSVVGGEAVANNGGITLENAQYLVPSLNFRKAGTSLNQALFLRGVGTINFSIAAEPSVAFVLDGVVMARAGEAFGDLYDLQRIEVLKGPQGTLFGKNSSAGVVNIVTGDGATDTANTFTGAITATVVEVLPNGHLVVVGEKQIGVNQNVDVLRFSGTIDPRALQPGSIVNSTQVANVRVESRGRGAQNEAQALGWMNRVFNTITPF